MGQDRFREHQTLTKIIAGGTIAIGGLVTGALTLGAAVSGISFALGGLATLGPVLAGLKAGFAGLALVTAPISGTVLAIGAAVAGVGLAAYQVWKHWEPIKQLFFDIGNKIGSVMKRIPLVGRLFKQEKTPETSRPFVRAVDRMPQGRGATSNIRQENSITIPVSVGAGADHKAVTQAVQDGVTSAMDNMRGMMAQERRLAYE